MFGVQFTVNTDTINWNNILGLSATTWLNIVVIIVLAVIASIGVDVVKKRNEIKNLKKVGKKVATYLLLAFNTILTGLSLTLPFVQQNLHFLGTIPFLGAHIGGATALMVIIYNLFTDKKTQAVAEWLTQRVQPAKQTSAAPTSDQTDAPNQLLQ